MSHKHTFSIEHEINPETGRPFGQRFAGEFTVRRPTTEDRESISLLDASNLCRLGKVDISLLNKDVVNLSYIFAHMSVIGEKLPPWFDKSALYDEDEIAVYSAWSEVSRWLATFRPKTDPKNSSGDGGDASVLVSPPLQPAAN